MAIEVINRTTDFNRPVLEAEVAAISPTLPAFTLKWSGFESADGFDRLGPFPEATRVIATRNGVDDVADRGDFRIDTRNALTAAQVASIETALDAHDPSIASDTPEQTKRRQNVADVAALRVLYDAGIADSTLELTTKLTLIEAGEDL